MNGVVCLPSTSAFSLKKNKRRAWLMREATNEFSKENLQKLLRLPGLGHYDDLN